MTLDIGVVRTLEEGRLVLYPRGDWDGGRFELLLDGRELLLRGTLGEACTTFVTPPEGVGSSNMTMSSPESAVRSMTSSCMLSRAAFSTSFWAASPEAQDFSSCSLRSAAY